MKMKDKKAEQKKRKEAHKKRLLRAKKRRRSAPDLSRAEPSKPEKANILIVCEGEVTEPSYFQQFRLSSATIKAVGEGYNTVTLVQRAIELSNEGEYDQVWCVFDKDDFPAQDFNNAIQIAAASDLKVAYSNQAFEYWLILHFDDHQGGGMHRNQYCAKINDCLKVFGINYDCKGKRISDDLFELMLAEGRQQDAIQRAKRNYDRLDHHSPASEESSTTVFRLVEEMLKYQ
jgi:hypothetical protein